MTAHPALVVHPRLGRLGDLDVERRVFDDRRQTVSHIVCPNGTLADGTCPRWLAAAARASDAWWTAHVRAKYPQPERRTQ